MNLGEVQSVSNPPKLVLLPGLDGTGILFRSLLASLPKDIRPKVITYPPNQKFSLSELAQLVAQELPREEVVLLAESFSGLVALALLARGLPHIRGVLFVASFAEPPRPQMLRFASKVSWIGSVMRLAPSFFLRQFCLGRNADTQELSLLREALLTVSPEVLTHRLKLISECLSFEKIRFQIPCYYLQANQDRLVPPSAKNWFQQHFDGCVVESMEGPHFLMQAKPRECAEWVAKKLKSF
ncbi:alpha/beta fold hydrolase [Sulfuricaulis limicola]|uniref:alpha/beta fold hydrolase n=1 Tax=Sulfuricaulis limicola TaxID=1620215 RepID=UPI001551E5EE|nr:alpha/beta hydrolase [Sulfuricaulis limicola]